MKPVWSSVGDHVETVTDNGKAGDLSVSTQGHRDVQADALAVDQHFTAEEVALGHRVNRKMDFIMLPVLSLLYLFNGLDKSNVGNAETQGMCCSLASPRLCIFQAYTRITEKFLDVADDICLWESFIETNVLTKRLYARHWGPTF